MGGKGANCSSGTHNQSLNQFGEQMSEAMKYTKSDYTYICT